MTGIDCDRCEALLIDLACEELESSVASDVRRHARACETCGASLRKIERGMGWARSLSLEEPPAHVSAAIVEAAREHIAAGAALAGHRSQTSRSAAAGWLSRLRAMLGELAMGQQVAMATVMVLVVAVGLWFVPRARQRDIAAGTVVRPDGDGEAGPSAALTPAAPLDLDLRQGRIRTRGEQVPARRTRIEPATERQASATPSDKPTEHTRVASAKEGAAQPGVVEGASRAAIGLNEFVEMNEERLANAERRSDENEAEPSAKGGPSGASAGMSAGSAIAAEPPPAKTTATRAIVAEAAEAAADDARSEAVAPANGFAPPPSSPRPAAATAPQSETPTPADAVAEAQVAYRAGRYMDAIAVLEDVRASRGGQLPLGARVLLARSYRHVDRCGDAVVHYEIFLRATTTHRDAMLELADCYRQLGRATEASTWTSRAAALSASGSGK